MSEFIRQAIRDGRMIAQARRAIRADARRQIGYGDAVTIVACEAPPEGGRVR